MVRPFNFNYTGKDAAQIKLLIDSYAYRNIQFYADYDYTDYSYLLGTDFDTPEKMAAYFYWTHQPAGYYVDFPNPQFVTIKLLVDPCRNKANDLCCDGTNESVCSDNIRIVSGTDIGVAWFTNGFVIKCDGIFYDMAVCGTYIEIHKPNSPIIEDEY